MRALFLALLAPALLAAPALAQKKPGAKTAAAVTPELKAEFAASDKNKDGFLSPAEVQARVDRMAAGGKQFGGGMSHELAATWFAKADANKDKRVSLFEMGQLLRATAARYDTNHDGVVSLSERAAARREAMAEARGGAARPQGPTR